MSYWLPTIMAMVQTTDNYKSAIDYFIKLRVRSVSDLEQLNVMSLALLPPKTWTVYFTVKYFLPTFFDSFVLRVA